MSKYWIFEDEYEAYENMDLIQALNEQNKEIDDLKQELQRKDNNWNELKEFIQNELNNNVDKEKSFSGYQCKVILDKIKELENSESDE